MLVFNYFHFQRTDIHGYIFAYIWICLLLDLKDTIIKLVFALVLQETHEEST